MSTITDTDTDTDTRDGPCPLRCDDGKFIDPEGSITVCPFCPSVCDGCGGTLPADQPACAWCHMATAAPVDEIGGWTLTYQDLR